MTLCRPATLDDLPALLEIEAAAFTEDDRFTRRTIRQKLDSPSAFVTICEVDGRPAGSAILLFRKGVTVARLYSIATHPALGNKGAGAALIEACEAEALARDCDRLRLEVRAGNTKARSLYARCGYSLHDTRDGYYSNGESALVLERDLRAETA
ncbi:GNAT family N-acetyltransferase [Hyphobacterium sp.]|uniref:GNAT family N-acetyltransferase n=1 Tax=Hyphobacterium sp. TaxID=2004662 RepID=UPI0037490185